MRREKGKAKQKKRYEDPIGRDFLQELEDISRVIEGNLVESRLFETLVCIWHLIDDRHGVVEGEALGDEFLRLSVSW